MEEIFSVDAQPLDKIVDVQVDAQVDAQPLDKTVDAQLLDKTVDAQVDAQLLDKTVDAQLLDKTKILYQQKMISCGKKDCKKCPHGPYLYSYQRLGGKLVSKYVGKVKA